MKVLLSALAVGFALAVPASATAEECNPLSPNPALCGPIAPEGHRFHGTQQQALQNRVVVCHPNWDNLARKWYSYAIFVEGQLPQLVRSLKHSGQWNQQVELHEGQECHDRFYGENWRFAVYDPCVVEGYNVLRIATPSPNGRLDSPEEWPIVRGTDGKPLLFPM